MASVNYLGRIQLDEIHTQATNKTTAQLLYSHDIGEKLKLTTYSTLRYLSLMPPV